MPNTASTNRAGLPVLGCLAWAAVAMLAGCAHLNHVQIDEVDSSQGRLEPFEVLVSETGVSASEAIQAGKVLSGGANSRTMNDTGTVVALVQFGPKTGNPSLSDDYADRAMAEILARCPSGRVTGLMSVRENRKYPVISGEIVKIKGFCIL